MFVRTKVVVISNLIDNLLYDSPNVKIISSSEPPQME